MENTLFSKEDYEKILQNRIKTQDIKFISAKMTSLSEKTEGFNGDHYNMELTYKVNGKQAKDYLFVKTKPQKNQAQIEVTSALPLYEKEILFYDFMIKEFEKYGLDTSFAPKIFFCIPDQTLVLEDLSLQGFKITERNVVYDTDRVRCLLKALAQLHAAGFAYERKKSEELDRKFKLGEEYPKFLEEILYVMQMRKENDLVMRFWKNSFRSLEKLTELLPDDENYKKKVKNLLREFEFGKVFVKERELAKTLGHGGLWSNNMMFRFKNDIAVECKLVDFQSCRYFYPAYDVIFAIYSNTSSEFRKIYFNQLYDYYYSTLSQILLKYGYGIEEIMPLKDFYRSIDLLRPHALLQVAAFHLIIDLPKDVLIKCVSDDSAFEDITVAEFQKSSKLRHIMTTAIYDLHDAIEIAKFRILS